MQILNALGTAACVGEVRNCGRCGEDFTDYSGHRQRVCPDCKKPRVINSPKDLAELLGQPLTPRQNQVAELVAQAKQNREIAEVCHLGEGTIKVIVSIALAKTGLPNRTALAIWWVRKYGFPS